MHFDWSQRAALERRMRGRVFVAVSRLLGRAVVAGAIDPLIEGLPRLAATDDDVLFAVRCQGIAGRLCALDRAVPGRIAPALAAAIADEARRMGDRGRRLAATLDAVGRAAAREGLAVVPLKGTALRITHAIDPSHRPSADLDLLIAPAEHARWTALLRGLGYTRIVRDERHTSFSRAGDRPADSAGDHPDHPCPIELHERLVETVFGRTLDVTAAYRAGLVDGVAGSVPVRLPAPPAQALHLVHHAAPAMLDRGIRLSQLLDLQRLDGGPETAALLRQELGAAAWAVAALADRDLPGLCPAGWRAALDSAAPGPLRRAIVRRRPGILTGDPLRLRTLSGELLNSGSPRRVAGRIATAIASRSTYVDGELQPTSRAGAVLTFARSVLARDRR